MDNPYIPVELKPGPAVVRTAAAPSKGFNARRIFGQQARKQPKNQADKNT